MIKDMICKIASVSKANGFFQENELVYSKFFHELIKEKLTVNLHRSKVIANILIVINIALIYVDLSRFSPSWKHIPNYKYMFYSHLIVTAFLVIYRFIIYLYDNRSSKAIISNTIHMQQWLYLLFIEGLLIWSVFLAINAQGIHGQISAYIIAIFCLASSFVLSPTESISIYLSAWLIFIFSLVSLSINQDAINGHIINSAFLAFLAAGVSKINYEAFTNNYINKRIITEKTTQLNNSHKELEEIVRLRTEQLTIANEELIREIQLRHSAEIEAIKDKQLYKEKAQLLEEVKEYEALRSTFFANISHELRTPLNVILSAQHMIVCIVNDKEFSNEKKETKILHYNKIIKRNSYRLIRLISNLIDMTKIDAGSFDLHLENQDIIKIVENITQSVVPFVECKDICITFQSNINDKIIACDPDKIERIMLNLISNAVKFTPQGGSISVGIIDAADRIVITVKDTGIGIPISMQEKIFQRFVQVEHSTKRVQEGSGIGLSLVRSIVEMHKGSISLNSREDFGSEFIIELPAYRLTDSNSATANESIRDNANINSCKIEKINIEFSDIYK